MIGADKSKHFDRRGSPEEAQRSQKTNRSFFDARKVRIAPRSECCRDSTLAVEVVHHPLNPMSQVHVVKVDQQPHGFAAQSQVREKL
jgi:hypothetical protein